jgi:myxalamid-type polyketide synthase MxaE and MxaD
MAVTDRFADLTPARLALTVRTLRDRAGGINVLNAEPIAVVGMACRFPGGASSPEAYWRILTEGHDAITEVPADRWDVDAVYDPDPGVPGKTTSRWGGLLSGIDMFDPAFFGIAPREAASLDPQQRLVLEAAWEALEYAGIPPRGLTGRHAGVFLGITTLEYGETRKERDRIDPYFGTGNNASVAAGRLSYLLGLTGPAVAVDTACSSSLTAVHLACQSLRGGETDLAIAGGVNVILSPDGAIYFSKLGAMAADGRCKTFDAAADGYVRGEGCGIVVLKTLSSALADGDPVQALIRGSAINQDGRSNGLTAPNGRAQEAVIRKALENGGVTPFAIGFVECHGTGTPLGDPIELGALGRVYRPALGTADGPLLVGSVKSNFGHLEAAAGIAGLIKAVLCLQHGKVPPNLHFQTPNPNADWAGGRLAVPTDTMAWPISGRRCAAVSSFGFSGSNAHVVLEEGSGLAQAAADPPAMPALLLLSGADQEALTAMKSAWRGWLSACGPAEAHAVAATAAQRRGRYPWRMAVTGATAGDLAMALAGDPFTARAEDDPRLIMVFPGQGSQWAGMGRELAAALPAVQATLDACQAVFAPHVAWHLADMLALDPSAFDALPADVIQPMLFAIQLALARQFLAWGIRVDGVIGHSMGEVTAACVAGALTLEDAASVICTRSRLARSLTDGGAMAMLEMDASGATAIIAPFGGALSLAAINGPRSTVVAGRLDDVAELVVRLDTAGIFARLIKVDYASHSPQMDLVLDPLAEALAGLTPRAGALPIYSTVTGAATAGDAIGGEMLGGRYWADNLRQPVALWPVVAALAAAAPTVFLEISPHQMLVPALREGLVRTGGPVRVTGTLHRKEPELAHLLATIGRLACWGIEPDWLALQGRHPVVPYLPSHPWRRQRYWLPEPPSRDGGVAVATPRHKLLGGVIDQPDPASVVAYRGELRIDTQPWLADHQVGGTPVLPGTAYAEIALAAAEGGAIESLTLHRLLPLPRDGGVKLHTTVRTSGDRRHLAIHAAGGDGWTLHAEAILAPEPARPLSRKSLAEIAARCQTPMPAQDYYRGAAATGVELGPSFRVLADIRIGGTEVLARLVEPPAVAADHGYRVHPALFDGSMQVLAIGALRDSDGADPYVPVSIDTAVGSVPPGAGAWVHGVTRGGPGDPIGDAAILDAAGQVLVSLTGVRFKRLGEAADTELASWLYRLEWQELSAPGPAKRIGRWLLLGGGQTAAALIPAFEQAGCAVAQAHALYGLDPGAFAGIVHLTAMECTAVPEGLSAADMMAAQAAGVGSLAELCRGLAAANDANDGLMDDRPRLWTVFPAGPVHASIAGLLRTVRQEMPEYAPGFIEVDGPPDAGALVATVLADTDERQIRLRRAELMAARLAKLEPDEALAIAHQPPVQGGFNGPVLVTGGFGGIGLVLAEALAEAGARSLVLAGRSLPDPTARARVAELQARGVRVDCATVDITDQQAVNELVHTHDVRGVIHAAGVLDDAMLADLTPPRLRAVLAPKIAGAWALHQAFADRPLDFLVFMSSTAAVFGGSAQGNYAAANAFLDALAARRRQQGLPALSIAWSAWLEVGMAASSTVRGARLAKQGIAGITSARGATIVRRLLGRPADAVGPVLTVLPLDVPRWRAAYPEVTAEPMFAELFATEQAPASSGGRLALPQNAERRRASLIGAVIGHLAGATGRSVASIDARTPLASLGFDSIMALEVRNRLQCDFGLTLSATLLWRHPTPASLAEHLDRRIAGGQPPDVAPVPPDDGLDDLPEEDLARLLQAELPQRREG